MSVFASALLEAIFIVLFIVGYYVVLYVLFRGIAWMIRKIMKGGKR